MPFSSKFYLLFAGNNFSIRWKKISSPNPRKNTFAKQRFFCIFMQYFLLKFYLDFGPKNTLKISL
jgi:hypothetical protein